MVLSHRANDHICHSQLHIKNFVLLLREGDQKYFTKKAGLKSVIHFIEVYLICCFFNLMLFVDC